MKSRALLLILGVLFLTSTFALHIWGTEAQPIQLVRAHEYATIRWGGRDNTHIIRPGGRVEFIGTQLRRVVCPDRVDDRAFYMNLAMNGLTKEGYRFIGMTSDEIVMERDVR